MSKINPKALDGILDALEGHQISDPEGLIELGIPTELVMPYVDVFECNPGDYKRTIFADDGTILNQVRGVHDLDVLEAIAKHVNADRSDIH